MPAWLLKCDPDTYGFDELLADRETVWDGVGNPLARKHLRAMTKGDLVLVYHTGNEKAVVGTASVVKPGDPEPVLKAGRRWSRPVTLGELRACRPFKESPLLRQGRLSVIPLTDAQVSVLMSLQKEKS